MSVSEAMTSLMDKVREIESCSDKLSIADMQLFLDALADLRFHKGWEIWAADINSSRDTGLYYCHPEAQNKPVSGDGFLFVISPGNMGWKNGFTTQYFIDISNKAMYIRVMNPTNVWSSWKQVEKG